MKLSDKFIKATNEVCDFDNHIPAPYFCKCFELPFIPEKAEITICGLGFYRLYINGRDITKGPLAPYISNPDDICYYDNYDISDLLVCGKNVIGILLGNGFRNSFGGFIWDFDKAHCRGEVITALFLEAKKGTESFELEADESFKTHSSPITFNDVRMGCHYDAQLEIPGWNTPDFDDSSWQNALPAKKPAGEASICKADPIVVRETLKAVCITHYDELPFAYESTATDAAPLAQTVRKNIYIYDFSIVTAGVTMLKINGKPGQKITIRHGEHLQDGKFWVKCQ